MQTWSKALLGVVALVPSLAVAHGEDTKGPHGGFVRMPGAYHTELLAAEKDGHFRVYLLDVQIKDPTTDGTVDLKFQPTKGAVQSAACVPAPKDKFFECRFSSFPAKAVGLLRLAATREGLGGSEVTYAYPLRLENAGGSTSETPAPRKAPESDHAHHGHH